VVSGQWSLVDGHGQWSVVMVSHQWLAVVVSSSSGGGNDGRNKDGL